MSLTTGSPARRSRAAAGIIAAAVLTAAAAAHAQTTPEQALLNHFAPTVLASSTLASGWAELPDEPGSVKGERALLVRTPSPAEPNWKTTGADAAPIWVNGEYALLGRSSPPGLSQRCVPAALRSPADPKSECPGAGATP
jgi:hypothetical protein